MKKLRRILVPIDLSAASDDIVRFAADFARRYDASLDLLFVFDPVLHLASTDDRLLSPEHRSEVVAAYQARLGAAKDVALAAGAPRVETTLLEGDARVEIVRFAAERGDDLVVMGTHGHSGFKRLWVGTTADRVVRTSPCPVLTLRATS